MVRAALNNSTLLGLGRRCGASSPHSNPSPTRAVVCTQGKKGQNRLRKS